MFCAEAIVLDRSKNSENKESLMADWFKNYARQLSLDYWLIRLHFLAEGYITT